MSSDSPTPPRRTSSYFMEGLASGATGAMDSLRNALRPSNYPHAARQAGQLADAVTHPSRTASTLRTAVDEGRGGVDVPRTTARTAGDMLGGAAVLAAGTMAGVAMLRRPYLASRFGTALARRYSAAPMLQHPVLQHPRVRTFALTRPLALGVGTVLGGAAFVGGARERATTATENSSAHPRVSSTLQQGGLHELAATPVSRVVSASPPPARR